MMNHLEKMRLSYAERKAAGLCVKCGKVPPVPGIARCAPCAKKASDNGKRYFQRHQSARVAHMNWYRDQHRAGGLCIHCTKPATVGSVCCAQCLARARDRYHAKKPGGRRIGHAPKRPRLASHKEQDAVIEVLQDPAGMCAECGNNPPMKDAAICWCCANPPPKPTEKGPHSRTHVARR